MWSLCKSCKKRGNSCSAPIHLTCTFSTIVIWWMLLCWATSPLAINFTPNTRYHSRAIVTSPTIGTVQTLRVTAACATTFDASIIPFPSPQVRCKTATTHCFTASTSPKFCFTNPSSHSTALLQWRHCSILQQIKRPNANPRLPRNPLAKRLLQCTWTMQQALRPAMRKAVSASLARAKHALEMKLSTACCIF